MHVVRTLATGGTENIVRKLLAGLDPLHFTQSVCTVVPASCELPKDTVCLGLKADQPAFLVPRFVRSFHRERPDIVHSRNWATIEAVVAARLAGVSGIVHSEHGRDLATMANQPWRRRLLRRFAYARADRLFCVSEELREHYCHQLGLKRGTFSVIPNGVDTNHFRPCPETRSQLRTRLGIGTRTIVIGTVGRLDPIKDHSTLLRATEMARQAGIDLRLIIVGDGVRRTAIEQELKNSALSRLTTLVGEVQNVADWLNSLDIFVLSSISEGMSNTLLEAMATGGAAIATAVGGNRELIENGHSGLLVPPQQPDALGRAIVELAQSNDRRKLLGNNARARIISKFSIDRMLHQYELLYSELSKPRATRLAEPARA